MRRWNRRADTHPLLPQQGEAPMPTDAVHATIRSRLGQVRRIYRLWPVLISIGVVATLSGLAYTIEPQLIANTVIGDVLPTYAERMWSTAYMFGGAALLLGIFGLDARWEVAGLLLTAACLLGYAYALMADRVWNSASVIIPFMAAVAIGCIVRACMLRWAPLPPPIEKR